MNSCFTNPKTTIALTCVQPVTSVPSRQLQSQPVSQSNTVASCELPTPSTLSTPDENRAYGQSMRKCKEEHVEQTTNLINPWKRSSARKCDNQQFYLAGGGGGGGGKRSGDVQSPQCATLKSTFSKHEVGIKETKQEYKFQYLHPSFFRCLTCSKAFYAPESLQRHLWEHIQKDVGFPPPNVHYPLEVEMQYHIEQHVNKLRQLSDEFSETINAHLLVHLDRDLCRLSIIFSAGAPRNVNQASFCLIHRVIVVVSNRGIVLSDLPVDSKLLPCSSPTKQGVLTYCCAFNPHSDSKKFKCGACPATFTTAATMEIAAHVCLHLTSNPIRARLVANCIIHFLQKLAQLPVASTRSVNGSIEMKFDKRSRGFSVLTVYEIVGNAIEPVKISSYVSEVLLHPHNGSERTVSTNNGSNESVSQTPTSNHRVDILQDARPGRDADFSKHRLVEDTEPERTDDLSGYGCTMDILSSEQVQKVTIPNSSVNSIAADSTIAALKEKLDTDQEVTGNDESYTITVDSGYFPQDKGTGISVELSVHDGCSTLRPSGLVSQTNCTEIFAEISSCDGRSTARISHSQPLAQSAEISFGHSICQGSFDSQERNFADGIIPRDLDVMGYDCNVNDPFTEPRDVKPQVEQTGFYRCGFSECLFSFLDPDDLASHIDEQHSGETTLTCFLCGKQYRDGHLLSSHLTHYHIGTKRKRESRNVVFVCGVQACAFRSNSLERYIRHYNSVHSSLQVYHCFHCVVEFPSIDSLNTHLFMSLKSVYQCTYCLVRSFNRADVLSHSWDVHANQKDENISFVTYLSCVNPSLSGMSTVLPTEKESAKVLQTKDIPLGRYSSNASPTIHSAPSQDCGDSMALGSDVTAYTNKAPNTVTEEHDCPLGSSWLNEALAKFITKTRGRLTCRICCHSFKVVRNILSEYMPLQQHILGHLSLSIHRCHLCSFECIECFTLQVHFRNTHNALKDITDDNVLYKNGLQFTSALNKILGRSASNLLPLPRSPSISSPAISQESIIPNMKEESTVFMCNFCHSFCSYDKDKVLSHISTSRHPRMMCCSYCEYRAVNFPEMAKHITENHTGPIAFRFLNLCEYVTRIDKTIQKVEENDHSSSTMNQISTRSVSDKDNTLHCEPNTVASSIDVKKNLVLEETKKLSDRQINSSQSESLSSHNMSSQRTNTDVPVITKTQSQLREIRPCSSSPTLDRDISTPYVQGLSFKCQLCPYKSNCLKSLSSHIGQFHPSTKVICSLCNGLLFFSKLTDLVKHHCMYHRFKPLSYKLSRIAREEGNSLDAAQILKCLLCPVEITDLYALDTHIRECHSRADIMCGHCCDGETFPSVIKLFWNHHGTHHGERPLQYCLQLAPDDFRKSAGNGIENTTVKHRRTRGRYRKQKGKPGRRKCSLNSYKVYFSSSGSEDMGDDSCDSNSEMTATDEVSSESDSGSDQAGDCKSTFVEHRSNRSTSAGASIKWRCMWCDFRTGASSSLQEHLKTADHLRCSSYCGKILENSPMQNEVAPKNTASMMDVYINLAWTQEQIEDKALTYCCHLCPFETRDVLDFQEHFYPHNPDYRFNNPSDNTSDNHPDNVSDNHSDKYHEYHPATDSEESVLNENDVHSGDTTSSGDGVSDENAIDITCPVAPAFIDYDAKREQVFSRAFLTNDDEHLSSQSEINDNADSKSDYLQEPGKPDSFAHSFRTSPRSSDNTIDGRRKDTRECALCSFRGDTQDDIYRHIIETHVRECQTECDSNECVVDESNEQHGASKIGPDLSGNLTAPVSKSSETIYQCPFCPITCSYDKLVPHIGNGHLIRGEGITANSDSGLTMTSFLSSSALPKHDGGISSRSGDILVDKTAVVNVRDVMELSNEDLVSLLDEHGVTTFDVTFPERSHTDVSWSGGSSSSERKTRKRIYGAYDRYWRIINKKFCYNDQTSQKRKQIRSPSVEKKAKCDSIMEDPNDISIRDILIEDGEEISGYGSLAKNSGKTSNQDCLVEDILRRLPFDENKYKAQGASLFVNNNDGNTDSFADLSSDGGSRHHVSTQDTVCIYSDDSSRSGDEDRPNGESAMETICVVVQLNCDDMDDNLGNRCACVDDKRNSDSIMNTFSGHNPVSGNSGFNFCAPIKSGIPPDDDRSTLGVVVKMEAQGSGSDDHMSDDASEMSRMKAHFAEIAQYINP